MSATATSRRSPSSPGSPRRRRPRRAGSPPRLSGSPSCASTSPTLASRASGSSTGSTASWSGVSARSAAATTPAVSWAEVEKRDPGLAAAAVRLHVAGLLALPDGARVREEHRHPPSAEDWIELLDDYVRGFLQRVGPAGRPDRARADPTGVALDRLCAHRPAAFGPVVHRSTESWPAARRRHSRSRRSSRGRRPRSGDRLRALVLCDHERATATLPARLVGVLDAEAGSARLVLERLVADQRTAARVADARHGSDRPRPQRRPRGRSRPGRRLQRAGFALDPCPRAPTGWSSSPADGRAGCGSGWSRGSSRPATAARWSAPAACSARAGTHRGVNALVDLTTATTASAVVQTRGRALRTDPSWPAKVATNWTVVAVTEAHPGGTSDWGRFVRKHAGYLAVDSVGEIVDGVAHVDDTFSPYAPPPVSTFDMINARMLERSARRTEVHAAWRVGTPYEDVVRSELRVVGGRPVAPPAAGSTMITPPSWVPAPAGAVAIPPMSARLPDPATRPRIAVARTWTVAVAGAVLVALLSVLTVGATRVRARRGRDHAPRRRRRSPTMDGSTGGVGPTRGDRGRSSRSCRSRTCGGRRTSTHWPVSGWRRRRAARCGPKRGLPRVARRRRLRDLDGRSRPRSTRCSRRWDRRAT